MPVAMPLAPQYDPLQTFLGIANKQTDQNNKLQQEAQEAGLKEQGKISENARNQQNLQDLITGKVKVPLGAHVKEGEVGYSTPNPLEMALKQNAMTDREDRIAGGETNKLQNAFESQAKDSLASLKQLGITRDFIKNNNFYTAGPAAATGAKGLMGQRLAASEIPIAAPRTTIDSLRTKFAQMVPGQASTYPIFSPDEQKAMLQVTDLIGNEHAQRIQRVYQKIKSSAPALAPVSNRLGRLQQSMDALKQYAEQSTGTSMEPQQQAQPSQMSPQDIMQRIHQLEAKKAASGAQ